MKLFILLLLPIASFAQHDSIDAFIADQMKRQHIIGLAVGIIKDGKIVKASGYGKANVELNVPVSNKTVFKIASLSKQFVAVGIMQLVHSGNLSLHTPVTKFIKNAPASWKSITIRHLLNHTSGLSVDPPEFDGMKNIPDSVYIAKAFKTKLSFQPGTKYEYSNFGYFILADVIRIISHESFANYMTENVFKPAGLKNTRTTTVDSIVIERASGYIEDSVRKIHNAPNYIAVRPSGAFLSNITDLLQWELNMQEGRLMSTQQWQELWSDGFKTAFTMDEEPIYYGFGWMQNKVGNRRLVHHGGSLPGFKSVYFRFPEDRSAIIVLTNSDQTDAYALAFGIADLIKN